MDSKEAPTPQPLHLQPNSTIFISHNPFHTTPSSSSSSSTRNPNSSAMIGPASSPSGVRLPFASLPPHHQPPPPLLVEQKVLDSLVFDGSPSSATPSHSMRFAADQQTKKKRGRPRKYAPDGNIALGLAPTSPIPSASNSYGGDGSGGTNANSAAGDPPAKRNRGRPPGSGKKQLEALGGAGGVGFTPHVIEIKTGEDIASKVLAFSQQGPRAICILSATGAVCRVMLRQATSSSGVVTYEGRFEIISLSGSFMNSDKDNNNNNTTSLTVSLAGPDGRILGGGVAGTLVAASNVQVIVGSFVPDGRKPRQSPNPNQRGSNPPEPVSAPPGGNMLNFGGSSPRSQGPSSDTSEENNSTAPTPTNNNHNHNQSHNHLVMYGNSVTQPMHHPMHMPYHHPHNLWGHSPQ